MGQSSAKDGTAWLGSQCTGVSTGGASLFRTGSCFSCSSAGCGSKDLSPQKFLRWLKSQVRVNNTGRNSAAQPLNFWETAGCAMCSQVCRVFLLTNIRRHAVFGESYPLIC